MLEYIGWDVSVQMGLLFTCLDNQEKSGFWENEKDKQQCLFLYCIFTFVLFLLFSPWLEVKYWSQWTKSHESV